MIRVLASVFSVLIPIAGLAADTSLPAENAYVRPSGNSDLSEFLWTNRPIVVFADNPADPRFRQQVEQLRAGEAVMLERDVVVLTDTDPSQPSPLRLKLRPRGFQLVVIDKDGGVILRKPFPWSVREISRSIDKLPQREREIRERRDND